MLFSLQEIVREISVWPDSVAGWVTLGVGFTTLLTILVGGLWKLARDREKFYNSLEKQGERIGNAESHQTALDARMGKAERDIDGLSHDHRQLSREVTIVNESVKKLDDVMRESIKQHAESLWRISDSVSKMQGIVESLTGRAPQRK